MLRACVALVLTGLFLATLVEADGPAVGWVHDFDGKDPRIYKLMRGEERIALGYFTPIYRDDRIIVEHKTFTIRLAYDNGRVIESVGHRDPPYVVQRTARIPDRWANIAAWAGGWFSAWQSETATVMSVHVRSGADGPISFRLFANGQARIAAGPRPLFLAWDGGSPPYEVRIRTGSAADVLTVVGGVAEARVRTAALSIPVGRLQVEILDRAGRRAGETAHVVERAPAEPADLRESGLPTPMRRALFAAWLAGRERGQWSLEAYQLAAADASSYEPAALLRDGLEAGDRPTGAPE